MVAIGEVDSTIFRDRKIFTVVKLKNATTEDLNSRVGVQLTFNGKLGKHPEKGTGPSQSNVSISSSGDYGKDPVPLSRTRIAVPLARLVGGRAS